MMTAYIYNKVENWWMKGVLLLSLFTSCLSVADAQVIYQRADSLTICRILQQTNRQTDVLWLARQFLDVPYVAHTLEVNYGNGDGEDREQLVVNTQQLDCTTLVETVTALKICAQQGKRRFGDYVAILRQLRYRGGVVSGYPSRLHYFSDWIQDKVRMCMVTDIQAPNPPFTAVQRISVSYMSQHPQMYKALRRHPSMVPLILQQEQALSGQEVRYIPKQEIQNTALLRKTVKDGDILAITTSKEGLDIAHLGFAVWRADGLHLLNASQIRRKVVEEPMTLRYYLTKHPTFTGIRVVRINGMSKSTK